MLAAQGKTLEEWSSANGYKVRTVHAVISGELKGLRGVSHRIAVDLGLKPDPAAFKQAA